MAPSPIPNPVAEAHDPEELASRLRLSVNRLHRLLRQESLGGLSPARASALGTVKRLGSPTLGELAATEQVQPPTMTRLVATLSDAGMVTRITDAADRRSARVRIRTLKNAFLARRLAELSPDEQAGAAELATLLEHLVGQ